jgi:hypothetical protein
MLTKTSQAQHVNSSDFIFDGIKSRSTEKVISKFSAKTKTQNIVQLKVYLGIFYFAVVSVLSLSLLN